MNKLTELKQKLEEIEKELKKAEQLFIEAAIQQAIYLLQKHHGAEN